MALTDIKPPGGAPGGGFTPGGALRVPFANAGGTALEDDAGFTWGKASYTLFGEGGVNPFLTLSNAFGSSFGYANNYFKVTGGALFGVLHDGGWFNLIGSAAYPNISVGAASTDGGMTGGIGFGNAAAPTSNPTDCVLMNATGDVLRTRDRNGGINILSGQHKEVSNADYSATIVDKSVAQTGVLSANRVVNLPAAASVPNGFTLPVSVNAVIATTFKVTVKADLPINGTAGATGIDLATDWAAKTFVKYTSEWRVFG